MLPVATTLDPALWKPSAASRRVIDALTDADTGEPQVLFVGGIVRNAVLGLAPGDADLATTHSPEDVLQRLVAAGIKVIPTGLEHGTVTAVTDGEAFEITTLRRDVETDGRHAVVAFTRDWNEDAQRRDFTINTLLADINGQIYDPTGQGLIDLHARRVIFVGDPVQRIGEDYLRILRFFRMHALYGQGEPDAGALSACQNSADKIRTLSKERITREMLKIMAVDNVADILEIMRRHLILPDLFHFRYRISDLNALVELQSLHDLKSVEARLIILCAGEPDHLINIEKYLLLSNVQKRFLALLFKAIQTNCPMLERLYRFGRDIGSQSALILGAMQTVKVDLLTDWKIPTLPISGNDLKNVGIPPGPRMGKILQGVETWWIAEKFKPGHDECLGRAEIIMKE